MTIHASPPRILLACAVSLALLAGCGEDEPAVPEQAAKPAPTKPAPPKPAPSKPTPMVSPSPPKSVVEQLAVRVELPDWYPSDAPMYPGAKLSRVGWEGSKVSGVFSTDDGSEEVSAWMNDFLASENWRNVTMVEIPNGVILQARQGGRGLTVMVTPILSGGETVTLINVLSDP